jgi:hypothetical protein
MQRYPKLQRVEGEIKANRGVSEAELQANFETATAFELALFGTLSMTGPRPGEIYALDWSAVYLDVEKPYFRIKRTWCSKGFRFYAPKTEAGQRTALAGVSERVAERVGLTLPTPPAAPDPPTAPRQPPTLRVIEGGQRGDARQNQRDGRKPVENAPAGRSKMAQVLELNGGADGTRTRDPPA